MNAQPAKQDLVDYADRIVDTLLHHSSENDIALDDVLQAVVISLEILKAIYPDPERLFQILQEAEGEFQLYAQVAGEC